MKKFGKILMMKGKKEEEKKSDEEKYIGQFKKNKKE